MCQPQKKTQAFRDIWYSERMKSWRKGQKGVDRFLAWFFPLQPQTWSVFWTVSRWLDYPHTLGWFEGREFPLFWTKNFKHPPTWKPQRSWTVSIPIMGGGLYPTAMHLSTGEGLKISRAWKFQGKNSYKMLVHIFTPFSWGFSGVLLISDSFFWVPFFLKYFLVSMFLPSFKGFVPDITPRILTHYLFMLSEFPPYFFFCPTAGADNARCQLGNKFGTEMADVPLMLQSLLMSHLFSQTSL